MRGGGKIGGMRLVLYELCLTNMSQGEDYIIRAGMVVGWGSNLGTKLVQEDAVSTTIERDGRCLIMAADGHGRDGRYISRTALAIASEELLRFDSPPSKHQQEEALLRTDARLRSNLIDGGRMEVDRTGHPTGSIGGSTLSYAYYVGDRVVVGWIGDSLVGVAFRDGSDPFIGQAHDSSNRGEVARVLRRSGFIRAKRVMGTLLPFRSLGNYNLKNQQREGRNQIVSGIPQVDSFDRAAVAFAFTFTDGLNLTWDRNQAAAIIVQVVREHGIAGGACEAILQAAEDAGHGAGWTYRDNSSVVLGGEVGRDKVEKEEDEDPSQEDEASTSSITSI